MCRRFNPHAPQKEVALEANLFPTKWTKKTKNTKQNNAAKKYYFFVNLVTLVSLCETSFLLIYDYWLKYYAENSYGIIRIICG